MQRLKKHSWSVALLLIIVWGCSSDNPAADTSGVDGGGGDDGGIDATSAPSPCTDDSQCAAATPRCEKQSRTCVECLPSEDRCLGGTWCSASFRCVNACATTADCAESDGGAALQCCSGSCVDVTLNDPRNCGACGLACAAGETCGVVGDAGAVRCLCAAGLERCNGTCSDLATDDDNCGACSAACTGSKGCVAGACKGEVSGWLFEDNLADVTATNNGAAVGTVTYETPSWSQNAGKALRLDGNSDVSVTVPAGLPLAAAPRTIEAWVRVSGFSDSTYNGILSYGDRTCNGRGQLLSLSNAYRATSANWCNDLLQVSDSRLAQAWSHVAFTWDGKTRTLYVDGQETASDTPSAFSTVAGELRIGSTDLPGRRLQGWIDDVRIYDYARTPAQLKRTVNQDIAYAFTAATDTIDSAVNKTSAGTKSVAGVTATADRKNAAGSAIALDGQAGTQLQVFPVSALGKSRPYTIAIWVKPTTASGTIVHTSANVDGTGWCVSMLGLTATGAPVAASVAPGISSVTADDAIAAGVWTHLATSWSSGLLKLYVNGVLKKTAAQTGFSASNTVDYVTLGTRIAGTACGGASLMSATFTGSVDDFKVWDRELTAIELAAEAK